jgi:nucleoside-diphosphate-sugar epimerase
MKILVTGGSGFVGGHLLQLLSGTGNQLVALHRRPLNIGRVTQQFSDVEWVSADLVACKNFSFLDGVSCVYHIAGGAAIGDGQAVASSMNDVNLVATERLARACKKNGVSRFVFVSSVAACEVADAPDVREVNGRPISLYGVSKRRAEEVLLSLHGESFAVTILRPTALFGEMHLGSMYELARVIRHGRFYFFGDGSNRTNFYYVGDFVEALMAVRDDIRSHGQVYIAADSPIALRDLVHAVSEAVGVVDRSRRVPLVLGKSVALLCDVLHALFKVNLPLSSRRVAAMVRDVAYRSDKLSSELGVLPTIGVREGIARSVAWYRKSGLL